MKPIFPSWLRYSTIIYLFILVSTQAAFSQSAIYLNLQTTSPEFPSLSFKDVRHSNQFFLQVTNTNPRDDNQYHLKLEIQGNGISMQSAMLFNGGMSSTSGHVTLYAQDLAPLFDIDAIQFSGITAEDYLQKGLPEGMYTVCLTMMDVTFDRYQAASNQTCVNLFVRQNLPPEITSPFEGETLKTSGNFVFQWMPRHISAMPVSYRFLVFEDEEGISPQDLLTFYRPVISEQSYGLQYLYDQNTQRLVPGKKYVMYVQAESVFNNIHFVNGGYSEPVRFVMEQKTGITFRPQSKRSVFADCLAPSDVIINEFRLGHENAGAFIELLVTGLRSNTATINLEGYIIDDNNWPIESGGNTSPGHLRLGSCFSSIPKGSIILIYDHEYTPNGIEPSHDGMPNSESIYQLKLSDPCIRQIETCPISPEYDYECSSLIDQGENWSQYVIFNYAGDVLQIRRPNGEIEHALMWNTTSYEFAESGQVVHFPTPDPQFTGFSFDIGTDWFNASNFSTIMYSGHFTPGEGNTQANKNFIADLTHFNPPDPFTISCSEVFIGSSPVCRIKLSGISSGSWYSVLVDGNPVINSTGTNPIYITDLPPGYHFIKVTDHSTDCSDQCACEISDECISGTPCDDLNSCTDNDVLDANCNCAGQPMDEIHFTTVIKYQQNCDYCISLDPLDYGMLYDYFWIYSISIILPNGEEIELSAADNLNERQEIQFHFPYCFGCQGNDGITLWLNDFNAWLDNNGYDGTVSTGSADEPCGPNSLIIHSTNLSFLNMQATSNLGDNFIITFESNCTNTQIPGGYFLSASLETCSGPTTWLWSTGETTPTINIPNLESCITVWMECDGCTYTSTFPEGGNCDCVVGSPCIPHGTMDPCKIYTFDSSCGCPGESLPDSDGDGVCDEHDACPGFDDNVDSDSDSVPDGCDICEGTNDHELTPDQIHHILFGTPENVTVSCGNYPCNADLDITSTAYGDESCDYCLEVTNTTTFPHEPAQYFKSIGIIQNGQPANINLITDWQQFNFEGFENGWGIWNDGGDNAELIKNAEFANTGVYSIQLKNQEFGSFMTTNVLDFSQVCQIRIDFSFYTDGFTNVAQDLWLEYSTDNGQTFQTVSDYDYSQEFQNNIHYHQTVYINGPFSTTTLLRLTCDGTANANKAFFDDVIISTITATSGGCFSTDDDKDDLVHYLGNWLSHYNIHGNAQLVTGHSDACGTGDFIQITDSEIAFKNINILGNGKSSQWLFDSPDCGENIPGQYTYKLDADIQCAGAAYSWSNGQHTPSILVPNNSAGYNVTVTCSDGCVYKGEHGNQSCLVGTPCNIPNNPCNPVGIMDASCNCVVEVPNTIDQNHNGIPDCAEINCDCEINPVIHYEQVTGDRFDICIDIQGIDDVIAEAKIFDVNNNPTELGTFQEFHFPYCFGTGGGLCDPVENHDLDDFRRDLYTWALSENSEIRVLIDHQELCTSAYSLRIENAIFNNLELRTGLHGNIGGVFSSHTAITGYSVSLLLHDDESCCQSPTYVWSDGSTGSTPTEVIVSSEDIGYRVTVTCSEGCVFIAETPGATCIVGTPCNDGDPCTVNDQFDAHCHCAGNPENVPDSDGDGVPDPCDRCEGFDDSQDDDGDTVPNGCDICAGHNDLDPNLPNLNCQSCEFTSGYLYTSTVDLKNYTPCSPSTYINGFSVYFPGNNTPVSIFFNQYSQFFKLAYCVNLSPCPAGAFTLDDLLVDLSAFLQAVIDDDQVLVLFENGSLTIVHSRLAFRDIYFECSPGQSDGPSLSFTPDTESSIQVGTSCDDGNPCTIFDRWDEDCHCAGIYQDSDGDGVCDAEDQCPGKMDYIDFNDNHIPDCLEGLDNITCNGHEISVCELFVNILNALHDNESVVVKENDLGSHSAPIVIQHDLLSLQAQLYTYFEDLNWEPLNMNYPGLINDIHFHVDTDGDGIVNYLDPCPDLPQSDGYITTDILTNEKCGCNAKTYENMVILYGLIFETVSFINDKDNPGCFNEEGGGYNITPGCAAALSIEVEEDDNCILRTKDGHCPIEFKVDCDGNCTAIYLGDPDGNHNCIDPEVVGVFCDPANITCNGGACTISVIVPNPAYPADPTASPCKCEVIGIQDADHDTVCDGEDVCPGEDDRIDTDLDGIPDCIDNCPNTPGQRGDTCDDGDPCTYADVIGEDCHCAGVHIDLDDDGVFDCFGCNAAHDTDGDGYIDVVDMVNGHPACDVCPGLDDMLDVDGDGRPDCIFPPYYPIGCPAGFAVVPATGFVLIFSNDDITRDQLPEPVSITTILNIGGTTGVEFYPYLTISEIRESNGNYEVLYLADNIGDPYFDITSVGITYAEHQQCILTHNAVTDSYFISDNLYSDLPCPTSIESKPAQNKFVLHFSIPPGFSIDPTGLTGDIDFDLNSSGGVPITGPKSISDATLIFNGNDLAISFSGIAGLGPDGTYTGTVKLRKAPNQIICTYTTGGAIVGNCDTQIPGDPQHIIGDPCDDNDPCTNHDYWQLDANNTCVCKGDANPDSDGDMICDAIDPCPDVPNTGPDDDGDGFPDCPCPELEVISYELVNGNDLEVTLDMTNAPLFTYIDVLVTGGPEDIVLTKQPYNNPFIIENLPFGQNCQIELKGVCVSGGINLQNLEVEVPFYEGQYVCGIEIKEVNLATLALLPSLSPGDNFTAADFVINVKHATGKYGNFTGDGYIKVPYFGAARVNVSFKDITVSAERQMVNGVISVDGFGVAVIGDDISDAINDAIDNILDPLISVDEILEELIPMLEDLDKLVETTGNLVSPETKACVLEAQQNLATLQNQQPAASQEQLQAATAALQSCLATYNQELAAILSGVSDFMEYLIMTGIPDYCTTNNDFSGFESHHPLADYKTAIGAPTNQEVLNLDEGFHNSFNYSTTIETELPYEGNTSLEAADAFYQEEGNYMLCKINPILKTYITNSGDLTPEASLQMLKILITSGTDISKIIAEDIKAGTSNIMIYDKHKLEIHKAMMAAGYYLSYK